MWATDFSICAIVFSFKLNLNILSLSYQNSLDWVNVYFIVCSIRLINFSFTVYLIKKMRWSTCLLTFTFSQVSGSKFFYLKNEAVLLEMALLNWTLSEVMKKGFTPLTTPEIVRSSIVEKCGFQPRGDNTQVPALLLCLLLLISQFFFCLLPIVSLFPWIGLFYRGNWPMSYWHRWNPRRRNPHGFYSSWISTTFEIYSILSLLPYWSWCSWRRYKVSWLLPILVFFSRRIGVLNICPFLIFCSEVFTESISSAKQRCLSCANLKIVKPSTMNSFRSKKICSLLLDYTSSKILNLNLVFFYFQKSNFVFAEHWTWPHQI